MSVRADYDHDALTLEELADLLEWRQCPAGNIVGTAPAVEPAASIASPTPSIEEREECLGVNSPAEEQDPGIALEHAGWSSTELPDGLPQPVPASQAGEGSAHPLAFEFEVPDFLSADVPETEEDLESEVDSELRAHQLAVKFLQELGEAVPRQVTRITDIILARKWSTAQLKVRELLCCGHGLDAIYRAFLVSEAWRQCDVLDERIGERPSGGMYLPSPRLSWLEAIRLVSHFGDDATVEDVIQFAESERHLWRESSQFQKLYPRFKAYLLEYRLSEESRRPAIGWYRTLAPSDGRDFTGGRNPEYSPEWWEDEIPECESRVALMRRIYRGDPLDLLISCKDEDDWWMESFE